MKKKPTLILAAIFTVIVLSLIFTKGIKTTFNKTNTNFSLSKFDNIDRVKVQTTSSTIELLKQDNNWKTSSGENADSKKINTLFGAIKNLQMQSPVSKEQVKPLEDSLAEHATKVTLQNGHKEVYSLNFLNFQNRIIASKPKGKPYYVEIKGYSQVLFSALVYTEPEKWLDKLLFDFPKKEIESVTVSFPLKKKNGFKIVNKDGNAHLLNSNGTEINEASPQGISDYLHFFRGVKYDIADFSASKLKLGAPEFSLSISTVKGNLNIQAYKMVHSELGQTDLNQFVGIVNQSDTVLLQYTDFDPIVVDIDFFK